MVKHLFVQNLLPEKMSIHPTDWYELILVDAYSCECICGWVDGRTNSARQFITFPHQKENGYAIWLRYHVGPLVKNGFGFDDD